MNTGSFKKTLAVVVMTALASLTFAGLSSSVNGTATGVELGAAVHGDQSSVLDALETSINADLELYRNFVLWDEPFPTANDLALMNGRDMILSIKAKANGVRIPWADIAAAQPGDPLHDDMVAWAAALEPYEGQIYLTFHHEPEASPNIPNGDASEYKLAWQNFFSIMDSEGVQTLGRTWIMTDYSFQVPSTDRRAAFKWYPGDSHVDILAADAYNWFDCRTGKFNSWKSLETIIEAFRQFGATHPTKGLMLTEFATVEDAADPNRKADWINDAAALFKTAPYEQFVAINYFDLYHNAGIFNCDWRISTSTEATAAFSALAQDAFYDGGVPATTTTTTSTTTTSTTTTTVAPPAGTCTVTYVGADVLVTWTMNGAVVLRRDGSWLVSKPAGVNMHTDVNPPTGATYVARTWAGGVSTDYPCVPDNTPPAPCTVTVNGADVTLDWTVPGWPVVRRNGSWLASPGTGAVTYTDVNAPAGATYEVRTWMGGTQTTYPCV